MSTQFIPLFQAVIAHSSQQGEWTVLVTPRDSPYAQSFRSLGLGLFPVGTYFSGRTALFEKGGRLTLVELSQLFETQEPFSVMFLGFEEKALAASEELELASWRKRAKRTITLGSAPGELCFH